MKDSLNWLTEQKNRYIIRRDLIAVGKYTCPCCGYKTLNDEPPGTYDICEICFWEDDGIQFADPDYDGGANIVSLRQGQQNYKVFGACEEKCIEFVRKASDKDIRDTNWEPYN